MMVNWAQSKGIHVVSDEIYGNSMFPGKTATSIAEVMLAKNPGTKHYMETNVHIIAGFSKDFCMSGLRVGTLLTHNENVLKAIDNLGEYSLVSNHTQWMLTKMLEDMIWTK